MKNKLKEILSAYLFIILSLTVRTTHFILLGRPEQKMDNDVYLSDVHRGQILVLVKCIS